MQHNTFLWWLAAAATIGLAAWAACWGAAVARHYAYLLGAGACPDGWTMLEAWRRVTCMAGSSIIRGRWRPWAILSSAPAFGAGALVGVCFVMLGGPGLWTGCLLAFCLILGILASIDIRTGLLPDALTQPLLWMGLGLAWLQGGQKLEVAFAGLAVGYGLPLALRWLWLGLRRVDALGWGDVKLLAGLGAWAGPYEVLIILLVACVAATLWSILRHGSRCLHVRYAFGPFLAGSAMVWAVRVVV